jgi:hypothetical protein
MEPKHLALLALVGLLAACADGDSNPVNGPGAATEAPEDGDGDGEGDAEDPGEPIESDRTLPPGSPSPQPDEGIFRREPADEGQGAGFARSVTYNSEDDTFVVDNLAFDGDNTYTRDDVVGSLGPFAVYENDSEFSDPATGEPVLQLPHKAIYGVSDSGATEFAIVRTGAYVPYGFGGFVYQRNGGTDLPTEGQATYTGPYSALRDFDGRGGMEYAIAQMTMDIDFEDFDDGDGVKGRVFDRTIFDLEGNDITGEVLAAITDQTGVEANALPVLRFVIGPGVLDANGEITGQLNSYLPTGDAAVEEFEEGNYYAVIGGEDASEVVGVIVVEADDPRFDGVTVRETGGFILTR